jgi:hypothetical protein
MRKISIAIILVILVSSAVFSEGSREQPEQSWGPGQGMFQGFEGYSGEIITVTGKIEFEENGFLELISGGETFELMYHFLDTSNLEITEGDEITVKGFAVPGPRWDNDADETHLMLTGAIINGKEYILSGSDYCYSTGFRGRGSFGRGRRPMMGGSFGRWGW